MKKMFVAAMALMTFAAASNSFAAETMGFWPIHRGHHHHHHHNPPPPPPHHGHDGHHGGHRR